MRDNGYRDWIYPIVFQGDCFDVKVRARSEEEALRKVFRWICNGKIVNYKIG